LSLIADLYNDSIQRNHARFMAFYDGLPPRLRQQYELERRAGKLTTVYTCKQPSDGRWVQDFERGVNGRINPDTWQTDTSIGDWFYNRHWKYQPLSWTVHMLVDIVSKNGNLLLNVVLRPDGSLDPEVETMLHQLADWTAVNGEAIYGTRPWLVFGEGPIQVKGGAFKEDFKYTASDIRFTTKGKTLYAIALGWPDDGKIVIQSLARTDDSSVNKIKRVELLGCKGKLKFTQTAEGLAVELPAQKLSDLTCSLKITGSNLKPVTPPVTAPVARPDSNGDVFLSATNAALHGSQLQLETQGGLPDIGYWDSGDAWVSWTAQMPKTGTFNVSVTVATLNTEASFVVEVGGETLSAQAPLTGSWDKFQTVDIGQFQIIQPGELVVKVRAKDKATWKAINLNSVSLTPTEPAPPAAIPPKN
jgi:alpha-L-fucosidase